MKVRRRSFNAELPHTRAAHDRRDVVATDTRGTDELWRLLWSHTARQIIDRLPREGNWQLVSAGLGWGLRGDGDGGSALLLYPSGEGRSAGDLSLLIQGKGRQTIPRLGHSYPDYLAAVEDVVSTVAGNYLPRTN
jgi:hypothetical protein